MQKVEHLRREAAECERKAEQARDVEAKRLFQEAAKHWRELAEIAERHGW